MSDQVSPDHYLSLSSTTLTALSPASQRTAWDRRYHEKGRQWGNAPSEFNHLSPSGTILELGVGDGKNLRVRENSDGFYIGIDFSLSALEICKNDPELTGVHLLLGDACLIPLRQSLIDLVFAHHILGHLPLFQQTKLMDEVFRVMKPGGSLALTVFASGDMREGKGQEVEKATYLRGDGIITRYFTPDDIRKLGFRFIIRRVEREEWIFPVKGRKYVRAVLTALFEKPFDMHQNAQYHEDYERHSACSVLER